MKHTEEEIINALKVIKEVCEENEWCRDCPLYNSNRNWCGICQDAEKWELNDSEPTWRAFV